MIRQPVIGLDVDDVLGDLLTPWLDLYRARSGDTLTPDDLVGWDMDVQAKDPAAMRSSLADVDYQSMVKPMPGALAAVEELRKLGRVVFVTACPQLYSAQPKYRWLQQHGFLPGDGSGQVDYFPARDKSMIRMDYLFDDGMHNIKACADVGITSVLVRRPHNRNAEWVNNVPGIYAAPLWVKDHING